MIFNEQQYLEWRNSMTQENLELFMKEPERFWKKTLCNRCRKVELSHDAGFNKTDAKSYYCESCLPEVLAEAKALAETAKASSITAEEYARMMVEAQDS